MSADSPIPDPAGALVPPPRKPPVARGLASPAPWPRPEESRTPGTQLQGGAFAFDLLDNLADAIRAGLRL